MEELLLVGRENSYGLWSMVIDDIETPALVYDEQKLKELLDYGLNCRERAGFKLLYAVKASALLDLLLHLAPKIDGFAVSSLFEARFIRSLFPDSEIHLTTPGIRPGEIAELSELCQYVSLNSKTQLERYGRALAKRSSIGIRVNTRVSSVSDHRYDPCRPKSKLGIPIEDMIEVLESFPVTVEGLHIHTNSDSTNFGELLANVEVLIQAMPEGLQLKWVNLGGGYLFETIPMQPLIQAVNLVQQKFGVEVFLEPGAGLVRAGGFLVSTILDMLEVDGSQIAILDTTVNHMPEVLEFDYEPEVLGSTGRWPI